MRTVAATIRMWNFERLHCLKHGDGWRFTNCGCVDWQAALFEKASSEYDLDYADYVTGEAAYCVALREAMDEAWFRAIRHVNVSIDGECERVITLRSSARRRKLAAERKEREIKERKERRSRNIRYGIVRALVRRISSGPSPSDLRMFFRRWKEVTGYGPKDEELRELLAPAKEALIKHMLTMAQRQGWTHGRRHDPAIHSKYCGVVYIDTPKGQVSFHVLPQAHDTLPTYEGQWSGLHNTPEILASLHAPSDCLAHA